MSRFPKLIGPQGIEIPKIYQSPVMSNSKSTSPYVALPNQPAGRAAGSESSEASTETKPRQSRRRTRNSRNIQLDPSLKKPRAQWESVAKLNKRSREPTRSESRTCCECGAPCQGPVIRVDIDSVNQLVGAVKELGDYFANMGRGSLLTAGDVEKNPGPQNKNVAIKANTVTVASPNKKKRRARSSNKKGNRNAAKPTAIFERTPPSSGRGTMDPVVHEIVGQSVCPDEGAVGWMYKYLDPAGSVESGKALGEFSKVPDGLLRYSVDAEQRPITTIVCPVVEQSAIPLGGLLWRVSFFSFPSFRLNFIALANTTNSEITVAVRNSFLISLNNLINWRDVADGQWIQFQDGWYYAIHVLPNTFQMAEAGNRTDSVTQFRKTYKGITFEFNAPTLIDQGWWVGGHVPIKPQAETIPATEGASFGTFSVTMRSTPANNVIATVGLSPLPVVDVLPIGGAAVQPTGGVYFSVLITAAVGGGFTFVAPTSITLADSIFAVEGSTVTFTVTAVTPTPNSAFVWTLESSLGGSAVQTGTINSGTPGWTNSIEAEVGGDQSAAVRLSLEMPAMTTEELTTNNPKYEQFLCKESGGAYIVHYKMNNPVFEMTGEENHGGYQFHYPEYNKIYNALGPRGIIDTFENNFSSAVVHFWGISQGASIVCKTYDGWEGTTNAGSTVGQFAHTGATEESEVMDLTGRLQMELTGVYPADDNFAALVSSLASFALAKLMKSEATPSVIKGIAQQAVGAVQENPGILETGARAIGAVGAKLVNSIKARRARRRARKAN